MISDKANIINWNKIRKSLKILPASNIKLSNAYKESECYKFQIKQLEGLNYQPKHKDTKRLAIKFNFSLFSNQAKTFFGRSFQTNAYGISTGKDGYGYQFDRSYPFKLFFHTQLEKSSATILIFEAYILEIGTYDIVLNSVSYGCGEINILNVSSEVSSLQFKITSMRQYLSGSPVEQKAGSNGMRLVYTFDSFPLLNSIKHLIPESVIVSTCDNIPGLSEAWSDEKVPFVFVLYDEQSLLCKKFQGKDLASMEKAEQMMMVILPTFKVFVTQVRIKFSAAVEKEFVRQVQQFLDASKAVSNKVLFKDRKLVCGFHNGWDFINRGGANNFLILKQGARRQIAPQDEDVNESSMITLEYNGMHEIDNIFDSPSCVVIIQLVYDIEYVTQARQIASRVVAWIPVSLAGKLTTQKELFIEDVMAHGPGKSLDGQRMISLPFRDEYNIQIQTSFSIVQPGANQMSLYQEIQRVKQAQNDQIQLPQGMQNQLQLQQQQLKQQQLLQFQQQQQQQQQQYQQGQQANQVMNYGMQQQQIGNTQYQRQMNQQNVMVNTNIQYPGGRVGQQYQDPHAALLDQQMQNEQRKLDVLRDQIFQQNQQIQQQMAQGRGAANVVPIQDYQQISWEPRNEQERQLKLLQLQANSMKDHILQQQREKDQIQMGLTQEYRLLREELQLNRPKGDSAFTKRGKKVAQVAGKKHQFQYDEDEEGEELQGIEIEQGRELDFNINKAKITYTGTKENPLIVHLNQPQYGKRELSKKDRIQLINQNIPGLLDDISIMNTEEQLKDEQSIIDKELQDPLKASLINFRILSFKPNKFSGLPKRMQLTMNFFDFPKYKTESFSYDSKEDRGEITMMIEKQVPIILVREAFLKGDEERYLTFKFEVDSSKSKYHDLHRDFIEYLLHKSLHIDIWDADTLMLYGSFKIPLNQVRRDGMNRKTVQFDLDIVNTNYAGLRGSIQVHIDHIGRTEANPKKRKDQEQEESQNKQMSHVNQWQNKAIQKSKVISEKSISIPTNFLKNQKTITSNTAQSDGNSKGNTAIRSDEAMRKMERIKRFKNNTLNQASLLFEDHGDQGNTSHMLGLDLTKIKELSQFRIEQIDELKNKKKPDLVKSVISKFLNEEKVVSLFYGKQEIIPYQIQNTSDMLQTYSIVIEDGDDGILPSHEIEAICDPAEWKYWILALGYTEPSSYDIIQKNSIVLEPNEKATVLFKCMTYRNIDPQIKDRPDAERISAQRDDSYRKLYINPRSISVFFCIKQQTVIGGFRIKLEPHQQVIDHIFRYYEKENKSIKITLPPLFLKNENPSFQYDFFHQFEPTFHITNSTVQLEWVNESEVSLFAKMPSLSKIMKFNILAYNSDFRSKLLANIQIELHALESIDLHVNMGQSTMFKLNVPGDIPRVAKLYSSNPDILWFSPPYDSTFTLPPGKITQIDGTVKSLSTESQKIQINAVDIHSNELIHSWIIRVETDVPQPSKLIELSATACKESIQVFEYFNRSKKVRTFSFLSSDPSLLEILDPSKQIMGSSSEEIAVKIVEREYTSPEAQVIVFISDYEETIFDTIKFRIRYIFNEEAQSLQSFHNLKNKKEQILTQQKHASLNYTPSQQELQYVQNPLLESRMLGDTYNNRGDDYSKYQGYGANYNDAVPNQNYYDQGARSLATSYYNQEVQPNNNQNFDNYNYNQGTQYKQKGGTRNYSTGGYDYQNTNQQQAPRYQKRDSKRVTFDQEYDSSRTASDSQNKWRNQGSQQKYLRPEQTY